MMANGIDNGHWYKRDGSPFYEIPKKGGGTRGVNLAWDKPLGLVPSVTTILQVLPKPQLEIWKQNQMMLAALTTPQIDNLETDEDFFKRIREDAFQQVRDACDIGTIVHNACEQYFSGEQPDPDYQEYVDGVAAEVKRLFPDVTDWIAEKPFADCLGFGGRVDLHSPSTGIVVDFKGKDGDFTDGKKLTYDQHYQLSAYQRGLGLKAASCANVFFSRTHPGKVASYVWTVEQLYDGWQIFYKVFELWKLLKKYNPAFEVSNG
jgi:hypothetical protein